MSNRSAINVDEIQGNASDELKQHIAWVFSIFRRPGVGFANEVGESIKIKEITVEEVGEKKKRLSSKVVCECVVTKGMLNGGGNLHGGCTAYIIDNCSSLPIAAVTNRAGGGYGISGVTQAINMIYHAPAPLGTQLEVISTVMVANARTMSARCEIWDKDKQRLVASGVHLKMNPSSSKL